MTADVFLVGLFATAVLLIIAKIVLGTVLPDTFDMPQNAGKNTGLPPDGNIMNDSGYTFPNGVKAGNIQDIGDRDYQSSYFAIISSADNAQLHGDSMLAVIADGISDNKAGRLAAVLAVETIKHNFNRGLHKAFSTEDFFEESFRQMRKSFGDNIDLNKYGVKLAAVIADGGILNYAAIGDCVVYLYRDKELTSLVTGHEKHIGRIALYPKDIVMLLNQGAYENLTEMEIIWYLDLDDHPQEKCQMLLDRTRGKRVRQGNSVIIIMECLQTAPLTPKTRQSPRKA